MALTKDEIANLSLAKGGDQLSKPPELSSRQDLANFLDVRLKTLTYVLYSRDRTSYYREFEIKKSSGEPRKLHAVNGELKRLQRRALDRLQPAWQPSIYAHGFTKVDGPTDKRRSIVSNAKPHRRKKLVIRVDLEDFFPSITFPRVRGMFMSTPFSFGPEAATALAQMACLNFGTSCLPQGGVLSPYISNMICRRLDKRIAKVAQRHRCHFTRYADDMTFSTNDVNFLDREELLDEVREVVQSEHFTVNESKTMVMTRRDRQVVTGIIVNDGLNVNRKYIRNIRAILYNCEKEGIPSQLRRGNFKDLRSSRPRIEGTGENTHPNETRDECFRFLEHLLGRIDFVRQVVLEEEKIQTEWTKSPGTERGANHDGEAVPARKQCEHPVNLCRVQLYENLLFRMFKLVEKNDRKFNLKVLKKRIIKRLRSRERTRGFLSHRDQREFDRLDTLKCFQKSDDYNQKKALLRGAQNLDDLDRLVSRLAASDPRFFQFTLADFRASKKQVDYLLDYPAVDLKKTENFLNSFDNKIEGMGAFTHSTAEFTSEKGFKILRELYDPVYFWLPKDVRKRLRVFVEKFEDFSFQRDTAADFIDVMKDDGIMQHTTQLKWATRFGDSVAGETSLEDVLKRTAKRLVKKYANQRKVRIEFGEVNSQTIFTFVKSIEIAIGEILESMFRHTRGDCISISGDISPDSKNNYELKIADNSKQPIPVIPDRRFAHGKLGEAIRSTNGLCKYYFEANFEKHGRRCLNMHYETEEHHKMVQNEGVVHLLRFRRGTESQSSLLSSSGQQTIDPDYDGPASQNLIFKLLLLDDDEDRRPGLESLISQIFASASTDSLTAISQEKYETEEFDIALVHWSNKESHDIKTNWLAPNTRKIFFSDGFEEPYRESEEGLRVRYELLNRPRKLHDILKKVLAK